MKKRYWIMKCEPEIFSIDDLARVKEYFWDGVRNYQVRNMFRDQMKSGDKALFYHSSTKNIGIAGEMEISKDATTDNTQFDKNSPYFDPNSKHDNPRWLGPTVCFKKRFNHLVTLEEVRNDEQLKNLLITKKGNRLSVTEISKEQYQHLVKLGK